MASDKGCSQNRALLTLLYYNKNDGLDDSASEGVCEDGGVYICEHWGDRGPKTQPCRCDWDRIPVEHDRYTPGDCGKPLQPTDTECSNITALNITSNNSDKTWE